MGAQRKKLKFQVESGKIAKSSFWGHKRGYIQGKGGRTPETEESPLFLSYRGRRQRWLEYKYVWRLGRIGRCVGYHPVTSVFPVK